MANAKQYAGSADYGNGYGYDSNGNQTTRTIAGTTYTFVFDYENRLTEVKQGATSLATFLYDADGNRVKGTVSGVTAVYIAGIYEYQGGATTKYYKGGGLRRSGYSSNNGVFYMLSDHLKSTSALVARNGVLNVKYFYYPYGARRGVPFNTITAKHFTGQYHETALPGGEGLSFYNARWYDPKLGAFLSADSIVPAPLDPQSFNRYAYAGGNPLRFSDPSGHTKLCGAACEDEYKWSPTKKTRGGNNVRGLTSGYDTKRGNSTQPISASVRLSRQASVRTVVSWLLYDEMLPNAQGSVISDIRFLNEQLLSGVFAGIWASKKSKQPWAVTPAVAAKATAMLMWKNMVQSGAEWDHKSVILERFGEWAYDERDGFHYRYDIWSNIHYGYVGRSAGFTSFELMAGAGAAQIIDRTSAPSYWSTWFDDPYDQAAIRVGIELYDKYGLNVSITEFMGTFDSSAYLLPRFGPASGEGSSEFGPFTGGR